MKKSTKKVSVKGHVSSTMLNAKTKRTGLFNRYAILVVVMVRRFRPSLKLETYSPQNLCDLSKGVCNSLTANLLYPTPPISIADQSTSNDALQAAILACEPSPRATSRSNRVAMRDAANVVAENLRVLADYVDSIAQGNEADIIGAGFNPSKTPVPFGVLPAPTNLRKLAKAVPSGQTPLKWNRVHGAASYNVYTAATPTDPFVLLATVSKASYTAVSAAGRLSYYTIRAVGAAGLGIETPALPAHSSN